MKIVILGAGIAGISAGHYIKEYGHKVIVFERDNDWGGLCANFVINGFRFDKFIHLSFAKEDNLMTIFKNSVDMFEHPPLASNYYKGLWLKHPAQNNLAPLSVEEKTEIINDFVNREKKDISKIQNYETWLKVQYGNYFAENFPMRYTRKYWGVEAKELETKWIGERMFSPNLKQVLKGAFETQKENFYYAGTMRYPKNGGYKAILNSTQKGLDIRLTKEVVKIDDKHKIINFSDGTHEDYESLISTLPLKDVIQMLDNVPENVIKAAKNLRHTSGYMVSLGFNKPNIPKHLWFYIYDENIVASRVSAPSIKSSNNVPKGCSSLQAEIFFENNSKIPDANSILEKTIEDFIKMDLFKREDIRVQDIRFAKYANVIFDENIYKNREIIMDYLDTIGIKSIGRFGRWDYLWGHQAYNDGMKLAEKFKNE